MMRQFVHRRIAAAIVACAIAACARNAPPTVAAARVGTGILEGTAALQRGITAATDAHALPVDVARRLTTLAQGVYDRSGALEPAIRALAAAADLGAKKVEAGKIQQALTDISGALGDMLREPIPAGALAELSKLIGNVLNAVSGVQAEVAKAVGGTTPAGGGSDGR